MARKWLVKDWLTGSHLGGRFDNKMFRLWGYFI